jgi:hypothetical protein
MFPCNKQSLLNLFIEIFRCLSSQNCDRIDSGNAIVNSLMSYGSHNIREDVN